MSYAPLYHLQMDECECIDSGISQQVLSVRIFLAFLHHCTNRPNSHQGRSFFWCRIFRLVAIASDDGIRTSFILACMNNVPGLNTSRQYAIYGIVLSQEDLMQCSYKKCIPITFLEVTVRRAPGTRCLGNRGHCGRASRDRKSVV